MSELFTPGRIGNIETRNRFVRSATFEVMADSRGRVTEELVRLYRNLARGEVGLIVLSCVCVDRPGKAYEHQTCLHRDELVPGIKQIVDAVHDEGGKIVVQLMHAGRQGNPKLQGKRPMGPSAAVRDPIYFYLPREMSEEDIEEVTCAFVDAARRAAEAGADGVQLHAAHTYLISQFLSPFLNRRQDRWGGSARNRFRLLKQIIQRTKQAVPSTMAVTVKLNSHDHTPKEGVTPPLARRYAQWLAEEGVDAVEVSAGSAHFASTNMSRGTVPTSGFIRSLPLWKQPLGWLTFKLQEGKFDLQEAYNFAAAELIKPALGDIPLILVGGLRSKAKMEEVLRSGVVEFVSLSRPFLREPQLVKRMREGKATVVSCTSCNNCLAAVPNNLPMRCYEKGLPPR